MLLPTRATRNYVVQQTSLLCERGVNVTGELERHPNPNSDPNPDPTLTLP